MAISLGILRFKVTGDKLNFHSFRHTFEQGCRNSAIQQEYIDAIVGHLPSGQAARYRADNGYDFEILDTEIQKLRYKNLDCKRTVCTTLIRQHRQGPRAKSRGIIDAKIKAREFDVDEGYANLSNAARVRLTIE